MSILSSLSEDWNKKSTIKSAAVKLGNSFCLGEKNLSQDEKIDVTNEDFLSKLTPALAKKIKDTLAAAEQKAQSIINAASSEAEQIKQQAYEQGIQEGKTAGQEQGYNSGYEQISLELSEKVRCFDKIIEEVLLSKNQIYHSGEDELLEFIVTVAEKLACKEIQEDKECMKNIIMEACSEIRDKEHLRILVHPMLAQQIYSISEDLTKTVYGLSSVKIIEDKTVGEFGVIIESLGSRIDARFSSRVDNLLNLLKEQKGQLSVLTSESEEGVILDNDDAES